MKKNEIETEMNLYNRIEKIINDTIDEVIKESSYDFKNWWKDEFETDVFFESENEFKELSDDDLSDLIADWLYYITDGFVASVCEKLGIDIDGNSYNNTRLVEEIWESTREKLRESVRRN